MFLCSVQRFLLQARARTIVLETLCVPRMSSRVELFLCESVKARTRCVLCMWIRTGIGKGGQMVGTKESAFRRAGRHRCSRSDPEFVGDGYNHVSMRCGVHRHAKRYIGDGF